MHCTTEEPSRVIESGIVRFHCRMAKDISLWCTKRGRKLSTFCRNSLLHFATAIKGGRIQLESRSDFLTRFNKKEKVEHYITLSGFDKEWIEKMAFSLKTSQSEIIRMALEWWKAIEENNHEVKTRWHTTNITQRPSGIRYCLWSTGNMTMYHFPTLQEAIAATHYT